MARHRVASTGDIPVGEMKPCKAGKESLLVFHLDDGRRREPLEERQVATAAAGQLAVNRAVLAQQISSLSDPRVTTVRPIDVALARRGVLGLRGAVGFQPITTTGLIPNRVAR